VSLREWVLVSVVGAVFGVLIWLGITLGTLFEFSAGRGRVSVVSFSATPQTARQLLSSAEGAPLSAPCAVLRRSASAAEGGSSGLDRGSLSNQLGGTEVGSLRSDHWRISEFHFASGHIEVRATRQSHDRRSPHAASIGDRVVGDDGRVEKTDEERRSVMARERVRLYGGGPGDLTLTDWSHLHVAVASLRALNAGKRCSGGVAFVSPFLGGAIT